MFQTNQGSDAEKERQESANAEHADVCDVPVDAAHCYTIEKVQIISGRDITANATLCLRSPDGQDIIGVCHGDSPPRAVCNAIKEAARITEEFQIQMISYRGEADYGTAQVLITSGKDTFIGEGINPDVNYAVAMACVSALNKLISAHKL